MEVAERARRVVHVVGEDVGNAVIVPPYMDFCGKTGERFTAGIGGHRAVEQVRRGDNGEHDEANNEL